MSMSYINKTLLIIIITIGLGACTTSMPNTSPVMTPTVPPQITKEYKSAVAAFNTKKYKLAIKNFFSILKKHPQSTLAHTNLGLIYLQQNNHKLAEKHFSESLKLTPANPIAHNHMGIIYRQQGQFNNALKSYKLAISFKPDYANAHLNLAILYDLYLHNISLALQHYHHYQALTSNTDKLVAKWIIDNERRQTAMSNGQSQ
ncbi:MAG: tetratricopeptide repeat protein [Gammaproteobacteria bacterium]|nr:tetratricopeptide repeat protein [Gammaproteobacteria bacterium]MCW9055873.1 tetratricopeptide repeat protein [Gammaproteobacteria bacterium]